MGRIALTAAAAVAVGGLTAPALAHAQSQPGPADCASLAARAATSTLAIASAKAVAAEGGTPAFCEVTATASPVPDSHIGIVLRLPYAWNGKLVGLGGGGWAGNVRLEPARAPLESGYAVMQTDAGHPSPNSTDANWSIKARGVPNEAAVTDFAWRAVHEMAEAGKAVARVFYGRPQTRAYFQGCSTGGRQGLMEAQRFPEDFDGIVAGAPVYDFVVQTSAVMRTQFFHKDPESNLTPDQARAVNQAVLAACDARDGVKDGIVAEPTACRWDPGVMQCRQGQAAGTCLTPKQVATVRAAYRGYTTRDGKVAAYPLMRGGELDWIPRSIGTPQAPMGSNATTGSRGLQYLVYADPDYDIQRWDPERDLAGVRGSAYAKVYEAANPDLGPFVRRGGKLILWHGGYDPGPSPLGTVAYYEQVKRTMGPAADGAVRLFIAPGVFHCGGGPGPDRFDMLAALDAWVEKGAAPATVLATKADSTLSRPLCPYPQKARYVGGDAALAASFRCGA
jgi:feruloyl esterase